MPEGSPRRKNGPKLPLTVRLSADGLAKFMGDLEAKVMRAIWDLGSPASARAVHEAVSRDHDVALLTVITVLNKLVAKRMLRRAKRSGVLHYEARITEADFRMLATRQVVEGILSFGPEAMTTSFVDVLAETDRDRLAELARLVRRRMREQSE
ncbi:MAG: BlaI/MecI/CopY family transcriptional regulator [Gemmatimonadota bacterium]